MILRATRIALALTLTLPTLASACERQEALDLRDRVVHVMQRDVREHANDADRIRDLAVRSAQGRQLLDRHAYAAACDHYRGLAEDHDLDLEAPMSLTIAEINAWEESPPRGCDLRSIVDRVDDATGALATLRPALEADRYAELDRKRLQIVELLDRDLDAACQQSRNLERSLSDLGGG